jgi:hypothetical protein
MTELMQQMLARKRARRRELAALPVGEKLRLLEEMIAETRAITASQPPKPLISLRPKTAIKERRA